MPGNSTIFKFPIHIGETVIFTHPKAEPLHVAFMKYRDAANGIQLWLRLHIADPGEVEKDWVHRTFRVMATGELFYADEYTYIGTVIDDQSVWHIHERTK